MPDERTTITETAGGESSRPTVELVESIGERIKRRGRLQPLRNQSDRAAAAAAVDLALDGHTVLVTLKAGGQRLYRPQWAKSEYPYRLPCPGCNKFRRSPRTATCRPCWAMSPAHKRAIAEANARRPQGRSADGR